MCKWFSGNRSPILQSKTRKELKNDEIAELSTKAAKRKQNLLQPQKNETGRLSQKPQEKTLETSESTIICRQGMVKQFF